MSENSEVASDATNCGSNFVDRLAGLRQEVAARTPQSDVPIQPRTQIQIRDLQSLFRWNQGGIGADESDLGEDRQVETASIWQPLFL